MWLLPVYGFRKKINELLSAKYNCIFNNRFFMFLVYKAVKDMKNRLFNLKK